MVLYVVKNMGLYSLTTNKCKNIFANLIYDLLKCLGIV